MLTPDGAHSPTSTASTPISVIGAGIAGATQALPFANADRAGYDAGLMVPRDFASPSTPVVGTPFWHAVS